MLQIRVTFDGNDNLITRTVTEAKGMVNADRLIEMILKEGTCPIPEQFKS